MRQGLDAGMQLGLQGSLLVIGTDFILLQSALQLAFEASRS